MKRFVALATVVAFAFAGTATTAVSQSSSQSTQFQCAGHPRPVAEERHLAGVVFAARHWTSPAPSHRAVRAMHVLRVCTPTHALSAMRTIWKAAKRHLYRYAAFRRIARYAGHGTYWSIPWCIVEHESDGNWSAVGSEGALGPYQLNGQGAPFPATTWKEKMAHHRIAAAIWAGGSGASAWSTAAMCGY